MIIIQSKEPAQELEAKILAVLKREHICAKQVSFSTQCRLNFSGLSIDGKTQKVRRNETEAELTRIESDLLLFLACNAGSVFSKEELFDTVWGHESENNLKVVANTISNLRKKIGEDSGEQTYIHTVPGGYVFSAPKENL